MSVSTNRKWPTIFITLFLTSSINAMEHKNYDEGISLSKLSVAKKHDALPKQQEDASPQPKFSLLIEEIEPKHPWYSFIIHYCQTMQPTQSESPNKRYSAAGITDSQVYFWQNQGPNNMVFHKYNNSFLNFPNSPAFMYWNPLNDHEVWIYYKNRLVGKDYVYRNGIYDQEEEGGAKSPVNQEPNLKNFEPFVRQPMKDKESYTIREELLSRLYVAHSTLVAIKKQSPLAVDTIKQAQSDYDENAKLAKNFIHENALHESHE